MIEKMYYLTSISLLISFLLSTASCSYLNNLGKKDSENEPAKQTIEQKIDKDNKSDENKKIDKEEDTVDLEDTETENGPTNLPEDVPFYKDGKIEFESSKGDTYSLKYVAEASTKTVFSFYKKELSQMGWALQPSINLDIPRIGKPIAPISAKKEKRNCTITILGNKEDECLVHLVINS